MACWLLVSSLTQTTFDVLCQGQVYRGKKLHQLAVVEPAKECDLRIKDVVVGELSMYMPVYCSSHCEVSLSDGVHICAPACAILQGGMAT